MAADQERADRIRALKQGRPDLTWRRIADYVGVTERSATDWQTKGGIDYGNARKLAELFEVDVDFIWRGASTAPEPSPAGVQNELALVLAKINARLDDQDQILREIKAEQSELRGLIDGTAELRRLAREIVTGRQPPSSAPDPEPAPKPPAGERSTRAKARRNG